MERNGLVRPRGTFAIAVWFKRPVISCIGSRSEPIRQTEVGAGAQSHGRVSMNQELWAKVLDGFHEVLLAPALAPSSSIRHSGRAR